MSGKKKVKNSLKQDYLTCLVRPLVTAWMKEKLQDTQSQLSEIVVSATLQITEDKILHMQKWQCVFNSTIYLSFPDNKNEKDLRFIRKDNFSITASTQELQSRFLLIVIMSGQPAFHLSNTEASW